MREGGWERGGGGGVESSSVILWNMTPTTTVSFLQILQYIEITIFCIIRRFYVDTFNYVKVKATHRLENSYRII